MKKEYFLGALVILANFCAGLSWYSIPKYPSLVSFVVIAGTLWVFGLLFLQNTRMRMTIALATPIVFGVTFGLHRWTLGGIALAMPVALWSMQNAEHQTANYLHFHIRAIAGKSLRIFFTALSIVASFSYYQLAIGHSTDFGFFLPADIFNVVLRVAERPLQSLAPGIGPESTLDDLFALMKKQLVPEWSASRFSKHLPWLLAIGFFVTLKGISVLFYYVSIVLATLLMHILLRIGVLKKMTKNISQELVTL